jgi:CheY-like chemotaxis protein
MALRLLVVDDIRDSADSLAMLLQLEGFEVRAAYGRPQAIEVAQLFRPNVFIMDLVMPISNGFQVAEKLRAMPEFQHAHFIACSGISEQTHLDEASKLQFDEYSIKPPELSVLLAILSEVTQDIGK